MCVGGGGGGGGGEGGYDKQKQLGEIQLVLSENITQNPNNSIASNLHRPKVLTHSLYVFKV